MDTSTPDLTNTEPVTNRAFGALSSVIYAADSFDEVYTALVDTAVSVVEGCHHASLMQRGKNGRYTTVASSDDVARAIDLLEQEHLEGPCLDAIVEDRPQFEDDLDDPSTQWPRLAREIVLQTPVRSAAGFRIVAGDQKIGALNLFSDTINGISVAGRDHAIILAAFASISLGAVHRREQARSLAAGLESNREIGKAVGLLMAFHKITDQDAFTLLRKASQDMNIKLAEVAREVVDHHNSGSRPPSPLG